MPPSVVYMMNTEYPNFKAHSVQITKMLFSLSQHTNVIFICNALTVEKSKLHEEILNQYGIDLARVEFRAIPKNKLVGVSFFFTLKKIVNSIGNNFVFYTRSYNLAKRLSRSKFIHNKLVILESHKKSGYYKEDIVINSSYEKQRGDFEKSNKDVSVLKKIYKSVDGIVFTSNDSRKIAEKDLGLRHTAYTWYPLIQHSCTVQPDKTIIYSGSLGKNKLIELLLDALANTQTDVVIDLIGGSSSDVERVMKEADERGVLNNLRFLERIPSRELPRLLCQYTFGLSLMEGLKVTDYIECGLTPVIPKIPMYMEIFNSENAIFFEPDSPASLSEKLTSLDALKNTTTRASDFIDKYSTTATACKVFDLIERCGSKTEVQ